MGRHSDSSDEEEDARDSEEASSSEEERLRRRSKKAKKEKKKKSKDKKHKKKSKKQRRRSSSEEEDGSSDGEQEWVAKSDLAPAKELTNAEEDPAFTKPKVEPVPGVEAGSSKKAAREDDADEWMGFGDALQTFSNDSKRAARRKQKELEREENSIDKLGQHVNELNPYWKDGGTGLPSEESETKPKEAPSQMIGDGGLNYLRKAFTRAKEQAAEEGRGLEEVVSERWGSLERFLGMLEEAENKAKEMNRKSDRDRDDHRDRSRRFVRPSRDSDDEDGDRRDRYSSRSHRYDRHRDREHERRRNRSRDRDRDRESGWRKKRSPDRSSSNSRRSPSSEKNETKVKTNPATSTDSRISSSQSRVSEYQEKKPERLVKSPSPSSDTEPMEVEKEAPKILTDKEMNELGAKLLKAEMFGNTELVDELKAKLSEAEKARQEFIKNGGDPSKSQSSATKVVTKVMMDNSRDRGRRKDKITETHKDGQRVRYFPDDDKYTLQNMFQKEKLNTAADENALFARLAGKGAKTGQDYDVDDVFTDRASSSKQSSKDEEREIRDVLDKEKQYNKVLDTCAWCFDGKIMEKHLILSVAEKSYLCVPPYQSMAEGHCLIVPMAHVSCSTELDEDVWAEMQRFRKALVRMFREEDQDMVIFETALFLKRHPHMYLECIPMPKETGELAPIYFKKAIQECETEWSQNKKLVDLRNRDVRKAIPKGLPYFSVDFGDDSCGFAHVVEDERYFPKNFAHEIVGGMMELDHHLWRKQKKDDFKTQRNKVMEFLKKWASYDWTREAE